MKTKKIALLCILFLLFNLIQAQDFVKMNKTVLKDKNEALQHNDNALLCAEYLLKNPLSASSNDLNYLNALQFLLKWMEATPEFTFNIDGTITKVTKSGSELLGVYLASMTKFVLNNKEKAKDDQLVKYESFLIFIEYCQDPKNEVKMNKELKKLIKAKENNSLQEYLKE